MKRDGDEPKVGGDELAPNAEVDVPSPNMEGAADEVDPKGLGADDTPKGEAPKAVDVVVPKLDPVKVEVLGANKFEDVVLEKGLADDAPNTDGAAKGLDGAADTPKPIPPAD